jgi:hypothetical protein
MVSKKSVSMKLKIVRIATSGPSAVNTSSTLKSPRVLKSGARTRFGGTLVAPVRRAITVVIRMLSNSAPGTRRTNRTIVMSRPSSVVASTGVVGNTNATGGLGGAWPMIRPPSKNPMNRMNRPMPTAIAFFSDSGTAFMIASRRPTSTSTSTTMPSSTMTPMAPAGLSWRVRTRKNATRALIPRPAASAIGMLAIRPMAMLMTPATRAVAAAAAPMKAGRAASSAIMFDRINGLRNRM